VLGLNIGAYGAEVVRSSIEAVPKGQIEAAVALNMTHWQTMRHVVLPQAFLMMLPPFGNLLIELLKSTALVSMITVTDLTRAGLFVRDDTLRTVEVFAVLLLVYFLLSLVITGVVRLLERRVSVGRDYGGSR
jgi:polar amino acid transport system permease protein